MDSLSPLRHGFGSWLVGMSKALLRAWAKDFLEEDEGGNRIGFSVQDSKKLQGQIILESVKGGGGTLTLGGGTGGAESEGGWFGVVGFRKLQGQNGLGSSMREEGTQTLVFFVKIATSSYCSSPGFHFSGALFNILTESHISQSFIHS